MPCHEHSISVACILTGEDPISIVDHRGTTHLFERLKFGGIVWLNKKGEELASDPGLDAWWSAEWWREQGERLDKTGRAIWEEPPPRRMRHLGGSHYREAGPSERYDELWRSRPKLWTGRMPANPPGK